MSNKYVYSFVMLGVISLLLFLGTFWYVQTEDEKSEKNEEVKVITSFYPMYVVADNLFEGIDGICLENLSEPQTGCLHDFQLTPEDMKLLSTANVFIVNGSGAESFLEEVGKQYEQLTIINATEDAVGEEETLMHAWMTPSLYQEEIQKIAEEFCEKYPEYAEKISANRTAYMERVDELGEMIQALEQSLQGRPVVLFSEAFEGFSEALGLETVYLMDLDEERQISSGEVADVIENIKKYPNCFILAEERYGGEMARLVKEQIDVNVVFLEPLTRGNYEKNGYLKGMKNNIDAVKEMVENETD